MKRIEDIPQDLQMMFDLGITNPNPENVETMLSDMREAVLRSISEPAKKPKTLRMSNMGRPDRQLWYDINRPSPNSGMPYSLRIKFLMGHLMEALILFLIKEAGHTVEDEQREIEIGGIKGHMDARIDGVVTDVKTASRYGMKKFDDALTLAMDDPFGYIGQISGYAQACGDDRAAFLAINKESGEIQICTVSGNHMINAEERVSHVKTVLSSDTPPARCHDSIADGKSGNFGLAKGCTFCDHKFECWADANGGAGLRGFRYSNGVKYLTHVAKTPNVEEIVR
jgi:hypothetical protein